MKIYLHPKRKLCSQETLFKHLSEFVPLTQKNIEKNFEISNTIEDCDYIFVGQITESQSIDSEILNLCKNLNNKIIVDIEGDFGYQIFDEVFRKTITCAGGPDRNWKLQNCFVRPQLSEVFLYLFKNRTNTLNPELKEKKFFFQGQINNSNRELMSNIINEKFKINSHIKPIYGWSGNKKANETDYITNMDKNLLSLCPKGVGGSSIRFYESCFFGNVPIILGNDVIMGESYYDTSFVFRIEDFNNKEFVYDSLMNILDINYDDLISRAVSAKNYYIDVVEPYMNNPMGEFKKWLLNNKK